MKLKIVLIALVLLIGSFSQNAQALTLTDDPATMVPLSMVAAQFCKDQKMSYWETFWVITAFSVVKEIADQAAGRNFDSGHIGYNLVGMTLSWFIIDF